LEERSAVLVRADFSEFIRISELLYKFLNSIMIHRCYELASFCPFLSRALFCVASSCIFIVSVVSALATSQPSQADRNAIARNLDLLPLKFEPNQGQATSDAKFLAQGRGFSALFKNNA
jgi:hypothetical protein